MENSTEFNFLDFQMLQWSPKLRDDVKIPIESRNHLATSIAREISMLTEDTKQQILTSSQVPIKNRLDELKAFQGWMDYAHQITGNPFITRAQVITQIYICFVYLGESWFKVLRHYSSNGSTTKKCCQFLTNNPVRSFRNAIAHANWQYTQDYSGIEFWARKGEKDTDPVINFVVNQQDLNFWQALARCVAYSSFISLE